MEFITKNARETQQVAQDLVKKLNELAPQGALVLALRGELGAGKTTFIQGLAQALGVKEKILSPTFVILKKFAICDFKFKNFYHLDCYRIENAKDLAELGFEDIIKGKKNLVAIEWAERVAEALPSDAVWIEFRHGGEDRRKIQIFNV